jgi:hypothetical protein
MFRKLQFDEQFTQTRGMGGYRHTRPTETRARRHRLASKYFSAAEKALAVTSTAADHTLNGPT